MEEDDQRKEIMKAVRALPVERQKALLREMFEPVGLELRFIRGFGIVDTSEHPGFDPPCIIYHLASGLWAGFDFSFEQGVKALEDHPEKDHELIMLIHRA